MTTFQIANNLVEVQLSICPWDVYAEYETRNDFLKVIVCDLLKKETYAYIEFLSDWVEDFETDEQEQELYKLIYETLEALKEMEK